MEDKFVSAERGWAEADQQGSRTNISVQLHNKAD